MYNNSFFCLFRFCGSCLVILWSNDYYHDNHQDKLIDIDIDIDIDNNNDIDNDHIDTDIDNDDDDDNDYDNKRYCNNSE